MLFIIIIIFFSIQIIKNKKFQHWNDTRKSCFIFVDEWLISLHLNRENIINKYNQVYAKYHFKNDT